MDAQNWNSTDQYSRRRGRFARPPPCRLRSSNSAPPPLQVWWLVALFAELPLLHSSLFVGQQESDDLLIHARLVLQSVNVMHPFLPGPAHVLLQLAGGALLPGRVGMLVDDALEKLAGLRRAGAELRSGIDFRRRSQAPL